MTNLISEVRAALRHYAEEDTFYGEKALKGLEVLSGLEEMMEEAVKALEWYADPESHKWEMDAYRNVEPTKIMFDGGKLARNTIESIKGDS